MTTERQDREFKAWLIKDPLLEDAIEWIGKNMEPEDVFSSEQLSAWAKDNGYVEVLNDG